MERFSAAGLESHAVSLRGTSGSPQIGSAKSVKITEHVADLRSFVDEALGGSPVRLVDARFLIELAERGGRLCRRQDLPEEAFVRPEALRRLPRGGKANDCLRILSISQ